MNERFTVIISSPDADGVVAGALLGRSLDGRAEALVYASEHLAGFFGPEAQQKLPRGYDLALCGPGVAHVDWDGRPVRPRLMDALRDFGGRVLWYSARRWDPEDRQAVAHTIGKANLLIAGDGQTVCALVHAEAGGEPDPYGESMVRFASGRLSPTEQQAWGADLGLVLTSLKADHEQLGAAVGLLMEERHEELLGRFLEHAQRVDEDTRVLAHRQAEQCREMGGGKVVLASLPPASHAFWAEASDYALQEAGAEVSLCRLEGRSVLVLGRAAASKADLSAWSRYVTDMLPAARAIGEQPDAVTLYVAGLAADAGLQEEVLRLMAEGAHLLRR